MNIELKNITLINFEKDNKNHIEYLKELLQDKSITERFHGLLPSLLSKNNIFGKGYFVMIENELVGYVQFGNYNKEENCVYLRAGAIDQKHRGKKIGEKSIATIMLNEISEYLFNNYDFLEEIKLTIAPDNIAAIRNANKCGYWGIDETHYSRKK